MPRLLPHTHPWTPRLPPLSWSFLFLSSEERELWDWVIDARTHPENWSPHGSPAETADAFMGACRTFRYQSDLTGTARDHCSYLMSQDPTKVIAGDNMHRGPDGKLVWDDGESLDQAGFHHYRSENVALGQATAKDAVIFWMQDDAPYRWGHRNAILTCSTQCAGVGHVAGGPLGHYWTLDMGTR